MKTLFFTLLLSLSFSSLVLGQTPEAEVISDYIIMLDDKKMEGKIVYSNSKKVSIKINGGQKLEMQASQIKGYYSAKKNLKFDARVDPRNGNHFFVVPVVLGTANYYLWSDGFVTNKNDEFKVLDANNIRFFGELNSAGLVDITKKKDWRKFQALLAKCSEYSSSLDIEGGIFGDNLIKTGQFDHYLNQISAYNDAGCE